MADFPDSTEASRTPAYLLASGIHTSLNGGSKEQSFFDGAVDLVTKGIPASLIAAGNELANIPATIGNIFAGAGTYKVTAARTRLADIDSNLARYYDDHALGIDTAGFIIGSLVPGLAVTKVLRAGQLVMREAVGSGSMGALTSAAFGLVQPNRAKYLEAAVEQISKSGNVFTLSETNLLKAFAAGTWQQALEGAAWTGMVNATMNQSPILDGRDVSDLTWDVLTGAVLGGAIGGLFEGIVASYKVKGAFSAAEKEVLPWTIKGLGGEPALPLSASDKILTKLRQLDAIPAQDPLSPISQRIGRTAAATEATLKREVRGLAGELADADQDIAKLLMRNIESNDFNKNLANLLESKSVTRATVLSKEEKAAEAAFAKVKKAGLVSLDDTVQSPAIAEFSAFKKTYVNVRTTDTSPDMPRVINLADIARPEIVRAGVQVGKVVYKQKVVQDVATLDHLQAEARYLWAEKSAKLDSAKTHVIGVSDIPMMQKAIAEAVPTVTIGKQSFESVEHLSEFTRARQMQIAAELKAAGGKSNTEIAKIVNADERVLFGSVDNPALWNARNFVRSTLKDALGDDPNLVPTYMKIVSKSSGVTDATNGHLLEGMAIVAQKEKIYQQSRRPACLRFGKRDARRYCTQEG